LEGPIPNDKDTLHRRDCLARTPPAKRKRTETLLLTQQELDTLPETF